MGNNVVVVDFGKEQRESAARLARLLSMAEEQEAAILRDPKPFLDRAADKIVEQQRVLEAARDALRPTYFCEAPHEPVFQPLQTLTVPKDEWQRLKAVAKVIQDYRP